MGLKHSSFEIGAKYSGAQISNAHRNILSLKFWFPNALFKNIGKFNESL